MKKYNISDELIVESVKYLLAGKISKEELSKRLRYGYKIYKLSDYKKVRAN